MRTVYEPYISEKREQSYNEAMHQELMRGIKTGKREGGDGTK